MSPANDVHFLKIENVSARLLIAKMTFYSGRSCMVSRQRELLNVFASHDSV
jgi:hypothetical protein